MDTSHKQVYYKLMEACRSVGSSPEKCVGCTNAQKEPDCKESNNYTVIHQSKETEIGCSALHLPIADPTGATLQDKIVPLEGKPYFTSVMGVSSVGSHYLLKIPRSFLEFLPSSSAWVVLCCRGKEWAVKCNVYRSMKAIRQGWKQFVMDNNLKLGDGCVFELLNNDELKFRVQILSGDLPASACATVTDGKNIDTPILID